MGTSEGLVAGTVRLTLYQHGPVVVTRPRPNYQKVYLGLKRKGVMLLLLWREYKQQSSDGLGTHVFAWNTVPTRGDSKLNYIDVFYLLY